MPMSSTSTVGGGQMIEFGRRVDGKFNIWHYTKDYRWEIKDVKSTHDEALSRVRELREALLKRKK